MRVGYLPDAEQREIWPQIEAMLAPVALAGGIETKGPGDSVWVAEEVGTVWAAFTLRLVGPVMEIRCGTGKRLSDWLEEAEQVFTAYAEDCGAERLHLRGRKGWGRFAMRFGWQAKGFDEDGRPVFEKELA